MSERLINAYGNAERAHASAVYANAPTEVIAERQRLVFEAYAALLSAIQQQPEVDPLFEAAHYQEGRDLLPDGVLGTDGGQK